jgi:hypothetical protein
MVTRVLSDQHKSDRHLSINIICPTSQFLRITSAVCQSSNGLLRHRHKGADFRTAWTASSVSGPVPVGTIWTTRTSSVPICTSGRQTRTRGRKLWGCVTSGRLQREFDAGVINSCCWWCSSVWWWRWHLCGRVQSVFVLRYCRICHS